MNKSELIAAVAAKAGLTKKDAEKAVSAFIETVKATVAKKKKVQLIGFGTFLVKERSARMGRNPKTGAAMKIKASKTVGFKAGAALKETAKKTKVVKK